MKKKAKYNKIPRRLLTATMSCVFIISLSSCGNNGNNYGKLNSEDVYVKSGNYSVTNGELWNELKWNASSKLEIQVENIILNEQINKITLVMNNIGKYDSLTQEQKDMFESKAAFEQLGTKYKERLTDYVVQDIYNLTYSNDSYWDSVEDLEDTNKKVLEAQYSDEMFTTYRFEAINGTTIKDLVSTATKDNENYLTIATNLSEIYYPSYAMELLAESKIIEEVEEGNAEDDDLEDTKFGYFNNSDYISKFKTEYANKHDLSMVLIRFKTTSEFEDTLRAFGLKLYNNHYYYLTDEALKEANNLSSTDTLSYADYCKYYDDWANSSLTSNYMITDDYLLEVFIQIYNYLYSGYRTPLTSGIANITSATQLNDLRKITSTILDQPADVIYKNAVESLKANNAANTSFTRDDLDDISTTFATYLYETLDLDGTQYSTATQNYNDGYYVAYKFDEAEPAEGNLYNKDLTDDDILDIITSEAQSELKNHLQDLLIRDKISESSISSYLSTEKEDVKVKIYDEATEISYMRTNTGYSKTLSGTKNTNLIATIEYNSTTWNLNIVADDEDENSIIVPGTTTKYGVYNDLERQNGQTTAVDLLSKKIIKDTDAYEKTNEDRDTFNSYIESILYSFSNDGYSSNGYSSSIGKYNFLMLYFHSADIEFIIDDYYRVQFASAQLLTDYSNDKLLTFFKEYTDSAYDNYFSLEGTRLVVSFDAEEDGITDDLNTWSENKVVFGNDSTTLGVVAKNLVYDIYSELEASTTSHSTMLETVVEEYNNSARVVYDEKNPVPAENQWAKYRKLGLTVEIKEFTATNSSIDIDFNLKQRLFDYADPNGEYQYFKNGTTPTIYIEPLTKADVKADSSKIVDTKDGYNLILVTTGSDKPSAKLDMEDYDNDDILKNIVLKYNEDYIKIDGIANENDKLTLNQIKLYVLEYVSSQTTNLTPSSLSSACSTFLSPVLSRFTGDATQREIILQYIENASGAISFTQEGYNESFTKLALISRNSADNYIDLYDDTTHTANSFPNWWNKLTDYLKEAK